MPVSLNVFEFSISPISTPMACPWRRQLLAAN
jgi:hypothetical protein